MHAQESLLNNGSHSYNITGINCKKKIWLKRMLFAVIKVKVQL